jgi:thiamine biosynthesis lipoprotein
MACAFEVFLRPKDRVFVTAVLKAFDLLEDLEQQMSVYRPDSELSRLNRVAASAPVRVEPGLYRLLRFACDMGAETGGAFDITTGALIRCWGFMQRQGRVPAADELERARAASGWQNVVFDDSKCTVAFNRPGVELNLGAIGKGYALDVMSRTLRDAGLHDFMVHAGHSSILACGNSSTGAGWEVRVRDPRGSQAGLGSVRLEERSLSTSGAGQQFFTEDGRRFGHILDPRTGWPSEANVLCSVLAESAARAEALSTALFVMSESEVRSYFERHRQVGIILNSLRQDGSVAEPLTLGIGLEHPQEART